MSIQKQYNEAFKRASDNRTRIENEIPSNLLKREHEIYNLISLPGESHFKNLK